ncbi:ATP-binding protein [Croceibacterium soli]|nr:ATP-binding protein [Croceibacterium soli]
MAMIAMAMLFLTFVTFYVVYAILALADSPLIPSESSLTPTRWEFLTLAGLCVIGLTIASRSAVALARRIVAPLHSMGRAARSIADGDLSARAESQSGAIGETAMLIEDFNAMAERLERAAMDIVTWNAQIAHELRTPLTILKGRLQGMADGVFVADEAMIRRLLAQVEGLGRLVEDLRIVSLVESERLGLELADVDLASEIEDLILLVKPALDKAGFSLELQLARGKARVDTARVRQAILALIDNAQRYADPGPLRIELRLTDDDVDLRVIDPGPGMPASFAQDAFRLFTRSDDAAARHRSGSGLGLAVVEAIARAHGGTASYQPSGKGSAFIMMLPRRVPSFEA